MQKTASVEGRQVKESVKITDWANEPTVMELQADLQMANTWHDDHVTKVQGWLNLRNIEGKAKPKTAKNRSTVQPKLVRKQAEWRYPALTEPFLSSEKTFAVAPVTWEDKKGAEQNELVLNYQFRTKLNVVKFIDEYVRTTVDEGTVVVKLGWCRYTKLKLVEVPIWEYVAENDPEIIQQLQQAAQLAKSNPQGFSEAPEALQESIKYSMENQVWAIAQQVGVTQVEEEKVVKNHPTLDIVHYENIYLDPSCEGDITKANFAVISFETSKAELIKDGRYVNLDRVNWSTNTPLHQPEHASYMDNSIQFKDELRKRVVAYEYWGFYDVESNDELVPIVATWIGNTMIRMEMNPFPDEELPLVIVPYLPVKGSITGEPDAELLEENQAILGAVTRGMIDLMGRSANGQMAFAKGTLDVVNRKRFEAGQDYEYNPGMDPRSAIYQHQYPEIPTSALNMVAMQNQEAEALTGVKAFSGGLSGDAYGAVAANTRGLLDAASKREMSILRRLAQGMEEIGRKIIAMNAVFLSDEEIVEVTNEEFVVVKREDLVGEFNCSVDISTSEIEEAKAQDLGFLLQTLGNTVPFEITKMMLSEIAALKRMPTLAHAIKNFEPQPDPLAQKKQELEIAKIDAEIQEIRTKSMLNEAKAREVASTADLQDLDFLEQETGTKHAREMDKQAAQAESNQMLEISKRILAPGEIDTQAAKARDVGDAMQLHSVAKMMS